MTADVQKAQNDSHESNTASGWSRFAARSFERVHPPDRGARMVQAVLARLGLRHLRNMPVDAESNQTPSDLSHGWRSTTRLAKFSLLIRTSHRHFPAVVFIVSGLAYTAWSEWYNTQITDTWVYAPAIPTLFGLDLSPFAQWLIIPALLLSLLKRRGGGAR